MLLGAWPTPRSDFEGGCHVEPRHPFSNAFPASEGAMCWLDCKPDPHQLCETLVRLAPVMQDRTAIIFGVPDMGPICTERHVPEYLEKVEPLAVKNLMLSCCVFNAPRLPLSAAYSDSECDCSLTKS